MIKTFQKWTLALACFFTSHVYAALPTARTSQAATQGDYIGLGKETAKDGVALGVQLVGACILIVVAISLIKVFYEITNKKAEWTDFGKTGLGGLVAAVIGIVLITQADSIF
ncbi:TIGR03745 family integrating conjugative element membrane protein [Vibrio sp.]|uniref:TIGR03745 family integrating conjugative element membrane protein n=1 Tax=Vibrio sp. TaxID=678 RepID=UPI003D0EF5AD